MVLEDVFQEFVQFHAINFLKFVLVLAIGFIAIKLFIDFLRHLLNNKEAKKLFSQLGYGEHFIELILSVFKWILYFVVFIVALAQFGFATMVINVILIFIALFFITIFIYSLKDLVPNAATGIYIARSVDVSVGDKVELKGHKGEIKKIDLFTITLEDENGRTVIIPNSLVSKEEIVKS